MKFDAITFLDGQIMSEIEEVGYKYLGGHDEGKGDEKTICERVQEKAAACIEIKIEWK